VFKEYFPYYTVIALSTAKIIAILKFNQEEGDRTHDG
jgi:hypothetical protein